jgi:NAD(P)-dependent dehydrogenase (short-subunit alcohol dehydrogenase family)
VTSAHVKTAVVTGANRGLGLECCRKLAQEGLRVILTARDGHAAHDACLALRAQGLDVEHHQLDVTIPESINALARHVHERFGGADVLVNNAGVLPDEPGSTALTASMDPVRNAMSVNVYGAWMMCQAFLPTMVRNDYGRIVNASSGVAHLTTMASGGLPAYRLSKVSLNAVTRMLAAELEGSNVLVNSVDPGSVRTRMGGAQAQREVEEGVDSIVWAATLERPRLRRWHLAEKVIDRGVARMFGALRRNGNFLRDRRPVNWVVQLAACFSPLMWCEAV